jgi:hypothetical protein
MIFQEDERKREKQKFADSIEGYKFLSKGDLPFPVKKEELVEKPLSFSNC